MMKKLSSIFFVKYLLIGICSLSFVNLNAQTCDENVLKALEQTRATTFENVNVGSEGYFYIRYPFPGTTYTFTDDKGGSYSLRYVVPKGGTEQVFLTIPVGKVHQKRTFSLKATNEGCVYQSGYIYNITPQITPTLSLRIEPEWCNDSGAIYYQLIGKNVNPSDYKVYYKKSSETAYSFNTDRLVDASLGVRTLSRGDYDLIAKHNSDASKNIEQKNITVVNNLENIDFTPTFVPTPCEGNGNIKVRVNSGKYPLYFTLYNKERNKIVRPKQTSNVFVGIPKGEYQVLVENFCAIGGGTQSFRPVEVGDFNFKITALLKDFTLKEHTCEKLQFSAAKLESKNVYQIWQANTIPYPFTIELTLTSPSNKVYPFTYVINSQDEFTRFFDISSDYFQLRETYQNIPIEYGNWTLTGRSIVCDKATPFLPVTKKLFSSIENYGTILSSYGDTCTGAQIVTSHNGAWNSNLNMTVYYVLEEYPAHFNPNTAGFYKINTTNPLLADKYVKKVVGVSSAQTIVTGDHLRTGDVFRFRVVSEDCNKEILLAPLEIKASSKRGSINNSSIGSCKADKNGSKFASWWMYKSYLDISEIKIINFDGDATQFPAGFSLPYVVNDKDRISSSNQNWILRDLPIGKYTYAYTDVCGNVQTSTYELKEEIYSVTFEDDCFPKVKGIRKGDARGWTTFYIERFDETTGKWKQAEYTGDLLNRPGTTISTVKGERKGKFRVVRMLYTRPELGSSAFDCAIVVAEKEFRGTLRKPKAIGFGCSGSKYHVAIIPQGGTPPFTYTLVSKKVPGHPEEKLNQHSDNENFFLNVDATDLNTYYVFKVTDACGQGDTVDGVIANFKAPEITADKIAYCNGQPAVLTLPDMGSKIKIQWYKNNDTTTPVGEGTTLVIPSVTNGDQYSVKLVSSYDAAINSCLSLAIKPYIFSSTAGTPAVTSVQGHDKQFCLSTSKDFDLNTLFTDTNPAHPQITKRIVDKNDVISVPANGKVELYSSNFLRKNTFVYRLENACGEVLTQTEATLEVKKIFDFDKHLHSDVTICSASTYNDIKQLILEKSKSELRANAPEFLWYNSLEDAQNETNPIVGTASIGTLAADSQKQLYLRLAKAYYCNSGVITITVHQLNTNAPVAKSFTAACALNVGDLKKLIDPTNFNNINIYQGGESLNDNFEFTTYTGITYTQKVGMCESQPAPVTLASRPTTQASPQALSICTSYSRIQKYPAFTVDEVKAALRELYPNATPDGIKVYNYNNKEFLRGEEEILLTYQYATFSIEEVGKCPSARYSLLFTEKERTAAKSLKITLCENSTVSDLKSYISGSDLKIYKSDVLQQDTAPIDWSYVNTYQYTIQENGKCPSYKTNLILNKVTDNVTPIAERGIDLCGTTRPTVGQVKALLGNNARIYLKSGNTYYERLSDNEPISTSWLCYYTLQEAGKCMSEKAPLRMNFTFAAPNEIESLQVFCGSHLTVADLETKKRDVRWYREATGGTALSLDEPLVEGDYYAAQMNGACESERKKVQVYPSLVIKSLKAVPTTIEKGKNTWVNYYVTSVPKAILKYRINGGAIQKNTISTNGTLSFSHLATDTTTLEIIELTYNECTITPHTTLTVNTVSECTTPPAPQFAAIDNAVTTMNGIEVKRSFTGTPLFTPAYGAHCQSSYNAGYAWLRTGDNSKLTYTFSRPVKSATVWLLLMGNTPNGIDKAKISLNCGNAQLSKVYDCKNNINLNGSTITSANGIVNDVAIKVNSTKGAFTELVIEDLVEASGYGFFVEICPTSVIELDVFEITENPQPQAACVGSDVNFTSKVNFKYNYRGKINYQWQKSTDGGATFADIAGANGVFANNVISTTLTSVTAADNNSLYRVVYTYTDTAMLCDTVITQTTTAATLTVNTPINVSHQPADATYCKDAVAAPLSVVATGANLRYQWYQNTTNSIEGATPLTGETGATYTPSTAKGEVQYYFVRLFSNSCTQDSAFAKVTVQNATTIVSSPVGATYCQNATATPLSVIATGVGTLHYQWYQHHSNSNVGGTLLAGETNATYTPLTSVVTTTYYYTVVSSDCGIATSTAAKIEIQTPTTIVTQPANLKLCHLEPTTNAMRVVATGNNLRYQWYDNGTNNSNVGGTAIVGEVYDAFVPPINAIGIKYYYATVQGTCGNIITTTAASAEVQTPTAITLQPLSVTYCKGTAPTPLKVEATGIGTLRYQWYYKPINSSTPTILPRETNSTYTPVTSYAYAKDYLVVVTSDCGVVTSTIARVEVKSEATIYISPQRATYCKGAQAIPLTVQASGSEPFTYQWYTNTTNNQAGATAIAGATGNTYTPSIADAGTRYYFVEVKNDCKTVTSSIVDVKVQEIAPPTVTQTTHTLCSGTNQTIASLQPQGTNIVWYATATDVTPLAKTTPLVAGTTYYVAQKNGTCESDRVAVAVTQGASGNETLNFQATNNSLNCIPTGQLRFQIQSPVAGKTYVVELVEMPATYTGTRTFTITESDKEGAVSFVKVTGYNMSAGSYKARLISCNTSVPVPVTIHTLQRDFPTPDRNTNDFGRDQPYRSILDASGNKDCNYLDIRYDGRNTNSPLYKYFNTPELLALYEYTAYSDYDLQHIYGGDKNNPNIQWRPVFSVPAGKTVANNVKMVYYDLGAHHRTYKDLQTDPTKRPNFYFRIKGHNSCNNQADPMLIGDMRFMGANVNFEGTCTAPKMSVKLFNPMFCDPATYVVKEKATGIQVATGSIKQDETKDLSVLNGGVPFDKSKEYEIVLTSVDGQVITKTGSFDDYYNSRIPQAGFTIATRCFGSPNNTKGYIEMIFREMKSQNIYSVNGYKVTLESAPAGYTEEPGKLKIGETVTITYRNPNSSTNNILAVPYQDDLNKNFTLPEGIYKIKLEDPCGKVIYLRNTRNPIANDKFQLTYPTDYQEKPLTPETRTECARVNVYPFKGNPAMDWLKAGNRNRNVYVYLYKRPNGINAGDVTVSSGLSRQIGGTVYIKAVYDPNNPASADQYFSLPRNQNSEGSYTFVYGGKVDAISSSENDVVDYISSNGTNGCVRTFTISVDDVLLNFDRNGYIGYKCEDNTGKIVVKAINGIGGSGNYQYDLYNVKNGTLIESKTAAKGTEVTFTNLGTFTGGQNSRWVKITDSACVSDPVWKELPITPLNNPQLLLVNPLKDAYCKGETVSITLHSLGAPAYQWTFPNGNVVTTTIPQLVIPSIDAQHAGVYRVVAQGLTCAANTVTFNYNVRILEKPANGKTYTFCAAATVAELKAKVATDTNSLKVYKNGTLVTDNNEVLTTTDAYTVSRFNATCETDKVAVTVTISNTVSLTVPATLTVTCTAANIDTTVNNWLGQATVTDTCGTATLTHNYTTVKPANWCNTSVVTVTFVGKDPQGNTVTKTSVIKVNSTPIVAKADTYTVTNGTSTTTTTGTVLDNDKLGTKTPTTTDVILTVVTTTTDVVGATKTPTLNNDGTVTVPSGTKSGTYEIVYSICERLNPDNCATATATVKVGSTPIVAKADTYTVTNGTSTTTTTGTVLDNDKLGTKTPTTTDVILTVVTATTDVVGATKTPTLNNDGTVTVPSGTKSGTYQILYSICERLNPNNCATATATVKVGSTPIVAKVDTYTITNGTNTTTTTGTVLDNDKLGTKTPTTTDVILTVVTTTTDVVGATKTPTLNNDGTVTVPSGTKSGTYEIVYSICERLNPNNCATATATVKVGSTPIVAKVDTYTITNGTNTTTTTGTVLDNDKLGTKTPTTTDVILTVVTTTTDVVGATKTPTLNNDGTVTVPSGTKSGTYEIVYSICERLNPNNCATATATVKVGSTPIVAKADIYTVTNGTSTTTTTGTVLDNDKLGTKTPTTTDVILTVVTTTTDVVGATKTPTLNNDGTITVPSGTKSGTYEIVYSICERLNPNNCTTATATVKVGSTPIVAKADTYTVTNGTNTTTTTGTVLDNDKLGTKTPTTTDVILTVVTTITDVVGATKTPTLNNDGTVTVPSGTKSGTYEIVYSICERLNPDNCATTTATVKVFVPTVATPTTIEAVNDGVTTITSTTGGTTPSVLTNDKLNGVPNPSISSVTLTWNTATPTGFTLNPNGTIDVAPNTPAGIHTISYTICAVASSTVCSTASIVVTVSGTTTSTTPVLPIAVDDRSTTAINTPVVVNVLGNDTPNGATTPNVVTNPANGTVVVNVDGSIEYRPNTNFEGTDTFVYEICNTDGCASATVTIDVLNIIVPYNGMSVDGDGKNDYFHIGGIERYPNNVVRIYNRWGVKVFEVEGYDNVTRVFRGISNGRVTIEQAEKLPQGTYYYVIEYYDSNNNKESLVGWLYLKK
ncbi:T9SS type B sorting domain-containing protein [Capnocytophaga sputigena]|uniref:T9SS type B sorting domain-containing protein n=1 Tax=Capnocytophaga sputigena TaxID=1019 RepID=UPI000F6BA647|nr:gliding motility-associated C-terminal domain-containing protein [Capnocytophaga sputigena]VEI54649.1 Type V secretory pathway, adhesin AidA [Capnocytophaga sputigena]